MKIARVEASGFRGLPDGRYDLRDPRTNGPADLVVVYGGPSSGKTSFLRAIVAAKEDAGPYGARPSTAGMVAANAIAAKVRVEWWLGDDERARHGVSGDTTTEAIFGGLAVDRTHHNRELATLLGDFSTDVEIGKMEYLHASRRLPAGGPLTALADVAAESLDRILRLREDNAKLARAAGWLAELGLSDAAEVAAFNALLRSLGDVAFAGVRKVDGGLVPTFTVARGVEVPLPELSDGEQDVVLVAATVARLGLSRSILLLDRPELYLAPPAARTMVAGLASGGRENQIIVTTTSPEIAQLQSAVVLRLGERG